MKIGKSGWILFLMTIIYLFGELGHFLIGVVSRAVAKDLHFGDKACFVNPNNTDASHDSCKDEDSEEKCILIADEKGDIECAWEYNGLGLAYQILAGPSFVIVFTISGIIWGFLADRFNRVTLLTVATLIFSISTALMSLSQQYWHLVLFRMMLAVGESGCSPLGAGILSDIFGSTQRALAMSVFNWGIYIGFGLSYTIGNYVTDADILGYGWRVSFLMSGLPGIIVAFLFWLTVSEPNRISLTETEKENAERSRVIDSPDFPRPRYVETEETTRARETSQSREILSSEEEKNEGKNSFWKSSWKIFGRPEILFLGLASCIRHSAGYTWGYNSALYFQTYYPDYDAGWWLTLISIFGGASGAVIGGYSSDKLVQKLGISARSIVLAGSQFIAAPFMFGLLYLDPPLAFFSLLLGYILAEMWFGVMFAILVELVPTKYRSSSIGIALFIINNVGGNLPILVDRLSKSINFRAALTIMYPGALFTSSILFFVCFLILRHKRI